MKSAVRSKVVALADRITDIAAEALRAAVLVPAPIPVRIRADRQRRDR